MSQIRELMKAAYENALEKGFAKKDEFRNFGEQIALVHSELSEALESHRVGKEGGSKLMELIDGLNFNDEADRRSFQHHKDNVGFELADAMIRIFDLAYENGIDLDWYISTKMRYNKTREFKHGKLY